MKRLGNFVQWLGNFMKRLGNFVKGFLLKFENISIFFLYTLSQLHEIVTLKSFFLKKPNFIDFNHIKEINCQSIII
jgi:hypothetical protein